MPLVQFRQEPNTNISRRMFAPKKVDRLDAWFKACRKLIPQIPDAPDGTWHILHEDVSLQYIRFTLESTRGQKCYVVIDRLAPGIG